MISSITAVAYFLFAFQLKRSESAFFWEERDIMAHANSDWIVQVINWIDQDIVLSLSCRVSHRNHCKKIYLLSFEDKYIIILLQCTCFELHKFEFSTYSELLPYGGGSSSVMQSDW